MGAVWERTGLGIKRVEECERYGLGVERGWEG